MKNNDTKLRWKNYDIDFRNGPAIMGILNVTPDSFSDGGLYLDTEQAVMRGLEMTQQGAAILDIGPASSRPGAKPVETAEQIKRAIPVIEKLHKLVNVPLSIDTADVVVAQEAVEAGAAMINDITALADERMTQLVADKELAVVLMHIKGMPQTMQDNPQYDNVVKEVKEYLLAGAQAAQKAGVKKERIFIDPGFGFGKTTEHNLLLLKHLEEFVKTGYKILVGTSRKRFIGHITGRDEPEKRGFGTAATTVLAAQKGASVIRVHDVQAAMDVVKIFRAVQSANNN